MAKKIFLLFFVIFTYLGITTPIKAIDLFPTAPCDPARIASGADRCVDGANNPRGYSCLQDISIRARVVHTCQRDVFGQVAVPQAIKDLGVGSGGISNFLNMLIILIYIIAGIVFVFMILWGAFEWLTSGGSKEGLESARKRIIHALIGIALFAIAFGILNLIGRFTGFTFFSNSSSPACSDPVRYPQTHHIEASNGKCIHKVWRSGVPHNPSVCEPVFIEVEDRFCK